MSVLRLPPLFGFPYAKRDDYVEDAGKSSSDVHESSARTQTPVIALRRSVRMIYLQHNPHLRTMQFFLYCSKIVSCNDDPVVLGGPVPVGEVSCTNLGR